MLSNLLRASVTWRALANSEPIVEQSSDKKPEWTHVRVLLIL